MRTEERWNAVIRDKEAKKAFTPRMLKDLKRIPPPSKLLPVPKNYYIWGDTDHGKTILACHLYLQVAKQNYLAPKGQKIVSIAFISFPEFLDRIKNNFNKDFKDSMESTERILRHYKNVDFLVIDDFGRSKPSDWLLDVSYLLINHRYEHLKHTVITSNKNLEGVTKLFGDDRISSRIARMGEVLEKRHWKHD